MPYKPAQFLVGAFPVHGTDIRAKIGFYPQPLDILCRFYHTLFRIIKRPCITFDHTAVFGRKLSCISNRYCFILKSRQQIFYQFIIGRNCILCHKKHKLPIRPLHCRMSRPAMIKFPFGNMIYRQIFVLILKMTSIDQSVIIFLLRIRHHDPFGFHCLFFQTLH